MQSISKCALFDFAMKLLLKAPIHLHLQGRSCRSTVQHMRPCITTVTLWPTREKSQSIKHEAAPLQRTCRHRSMPCMMETLLLSNGYTQLGSVGLQLCKGPKTYWWCGGGGGAFPGFRLVLLFQHK